MSYVVLQTIALTSFVVSGFRDFLVFSGSYNVGNRSANHVHIHVETTKEKPVDNGNGFQNPSDSAEVKKRSLIPSWSSWNPRLQLAVVLSALFILLSFAIVVSFFIDVSGAIFNFEIARVVSQTFVHLYAILCPISMIHFMPNLRRALTMFCNDILFCFS